MTYLEPKLPDTMAYPVRAIRTLDPSFERLEDPLTPALFRSRYLKEVQRFMQDYSDAEINDFILRAMNEVELMTGLNLTKVQYKERIPLDKSLYKSFVHVKTNNNIISLENLAVESSDGNNVFIIPPSWIEAGHFHRKQINLIPVLAILGASPVASVVPNNAGYMFLSAISNFNWIPAFFMVTYTSGVSEQNGKLPVVVNELVGLTAAMNVLPILALQFQYTSQSISQDGISQSSGHPGPHLFDGLLETLGKKRDVILSKLKNTYGQRRFLTNI